MYIHIAMYMYMQCSLPQPDIEGMKLLSDPVTGKCR